MTAPKRRIYVDATMASVRLLWVYHAQISPATIRQWGARGLVSRLPDGKFRYDLEEVVQYARERGLLGDR